MPKCRHIAPPKAILGKKASFHCLCLKSCFFIKILYSVIDVIVCTVYTVQESCKSHITSNMERSSLPEQCTVLKLSFIDLMFIKQINNIILTKTHLCQQQYFDSHSEADNCYSCINCTLSPFVSGPM